MYKNLEKQNKSLIIRLSSMGDVILALSVVSDLCHSLNEKVDFVTYSQYKSLLENHPCINRVYGIKRRPALKDIQMCLNWIKKEHYYLIYDLQNKILSQTLSFFSNSDNKCRLVKRNIKSFFNKSKIINKNALLLYKKPILTFLTNNSKNSPPSLPLVYVSKKADSNAKLFLKKHNLTSNDYIIAIHPGAGNKTKLWPTKNYVELIKKLSKHPKIKVIIACAPNDNRLINELNLAIPSLKPATTINESLDNYCGILNRSDLIISSDSGPMHFGAAAGKKVVGFFGPTPIDRWGAHYKSNVNILSAKVQCSPCSNYGEDICKESHHLCMKNILVSNVLDLINELL